MESGPVSRTQSIRLLRASGLLFAIVVVSAIVSLQFGASSIDLRSAFDDPRAAEILVRIRLPRVLLAAGVGFILGITGSAFQTLLRNPLADPFVLGVSGGAAAGATLVAAAGRSSSTAAVALASIAGSIVAIFAVLALARGSRGFDTSRLVLAGLVMNAMFSAVITLALSFTFGSDLQSALRWMMGGFFRASWQDVATVSIVGILAFAFLAWRSGELRMMLLGAEDARARGVDTRRLERRVFIVSSLATAAAVASAGVIGFVGLMVPHAVRLAVPGDFRWNLPLSGLAGAALMICADLFARMALVPAELPVGALTACIGVPFFFVLLRRVL
jgi:iron complex transport system permease protein